MRVEVRVQVTAGRDRGAQGGQRRSRELGHCLYHEVYCGDMTFMRCIVGALPS